MKTTLLSILLVLSYAAPGQILIKNYKCHFYDDQEPQRIGCFYNKTDTFLFQFYRRDIWGEEFNQKETPEKELQIGLRLCFGHLRYHRTKDSLYIATGQHSNGRYYYLVYIPEYTVGIEFSSDRNGPQFVHRSEWLIEQIRKNRLSKKDMYLINEKGQTCQDPAFPG